MIDFSQEPWASKVDAKYNEGKMSQKVYKTKGDKNGSFKLNHRNHQNKRRNQRADEQGLSQDLDRREEYSDFSEYSREKVREYKSKSHSKHSHHDSKHSHQHHSHRSKHSKHSKHSKPSKHSKHHHHHRNHKSRSIQSLSRDEELEQVTTTVRRGKVFFTGQEKYYKYHSKLYQRLDNDSKPTPQMRVRIFQGFPYFLISNSEFIQDDELLKFICDSQNHRNYPPTEKEKIPIKRYSNHPVYSQPTEYEDELSNYESQPNESLEGGLSERVLSEANSEYEDYNGGKIGKQLRNYKRVDRSRERDRRRKRRVSQQRNFQKENLKQIRQIRTRSKSRDTIVSSGRARQRAKKRRRLEDIQGSTLPSGFTPVKRDLNEAFDNNSNDLSISELGSKFESKQNYADDDLISRLSQHDLGEYVSKSRISMFSNINNVEGQTADDREKEGQKAHVFDGTLKRKKMSDRKNLYKHTGKALKNRKVDPEEVRKLFVKEQQENRKKRMFERARKGEIAERLKRLNRKNQQRAQSQASRMSNSTHQSKIQFDEDMNKERYNKMVQMAKKQRDRNLNSPWGAGGFGTSQTKNTRTKQQFNAPIPKNNRQAKEKYGTALPLGFGELGGIDFEGADSVLHVASKQSQNKLAMSDVFSVNSVLYQKPPSINSTPNKYDDISQCTLRFDELEDTHSLFDNTIKKARPMVANKYDTFYGFGGPIDEEGIPISKRKVKKQSRVIKEESMGGLEDVSDNTSVKTEKSEFIHEMTYKRKNPSIRMKRRIPKKRKINPKNRLAQLKRNRTAQIRKQQKLRAHE